MMRRFWNDTEKYCVKQKMDLLEVSGNDFAAFFETCERKYSSLGHKYVGLHLQSVMTYMLLL